MYVHVQSHTEFAESAVYGTTTYGGYVCFSIAFMLLLLYRGKIMSLPDEEEDDCQKSLLICTL